MSVRTIKEGAEPQRWPNPLRWWLDGLAHARTDIEPVGEVFWYLFATLFALALGVLFASLAVSMFVAAPVTLLIPPSLWLIYWVLERVTRPEDRL